MNIRTYLNQLTFLIVLPLLSHAEEGAIVVKAGDSARVQMTGTAKLSEATDKDPAFLEAWGMQGEKIVEVGTRGTLEEESGVVFSMPVPSDGYYDVYVRWFSKGHSVAWNDEAPIRVTFAGGERTYGLTQRIGNVWAFLGTFPAKTTEGITVGLQGLGTTGSSNLNAVKLVPVANPSKTLAPRPRVLPVKSGPQDEFDKMRVHAVKIFTASADADVSHPIVAQKVANESAATYLAWKTMDKRPGVTDLWNDSLTRKPIEENKGGGWQLNQAFYRIASMAKAYVGENAELGFADKMQGNPELLKDVIYGLEWMYENRYNDRTRNVLGGDWLFMEVRIPRAICETLLCIYPQASQELIDKEVAAIEKINKGPDKFYGSFVSTGYNRFVGVHAYILRSILTKNADALGRVEELLGPEMEINSRTNPLKRGGKPGTDGYYADGSFIQHADSPMIGTYGSGMLEIYGQMKSVLAGSPYALTDPRGLVFYDWVYKGFYPLFFQGELMYGSIGRLVGYASPQNGGSSSKIIGQLADLLDGAEPEHKARIASILKTWMLEKENAPFPEFSKLNIGRASAEIAAKLFAIKNDPNIPLTKQKLGTTVMYNTDYVVHHQPTFAGHLRMYSTRIKGYEDINQGENVRGWYQGEGALFLYNRDNSRYNDNFFATVNPYRLPGTTVDTRPREYQGSQNGKRSTNPWAGGVALDGSGLASMGLAAPDTTLTAKKAWFFFGDQILCLGTDIQSGDNRTIETIVENAKLHGEKNNAFVVNGVAQPVTDGWQADLAKVTWANLAGNIPGTDVGWVFPGGADLKAQRQSRTGKWTDSARNDGDKGEYTRTYLSLWFDHGKNPSGAQYAYIVLPDRDAAATKAYAEKPAIEILANSATIQAARNNQLGMTGANFWEAGSTGGITSSGKAAVLLHKSEDGLALAVSDPTQLEASVEITLDAGAAKALEVDPAITVVSLRPLKLKINLQDSEGRPFIARFSGK